MLDFIVMQMSKGNREKGYYGVKREMMRAIRILGT